MVVKTNGFIRTGIHTRLTTGTQIFIQDHDTVITFSNRFLSTGIHTGRIVAVLADIYPVLKKGVVFYHLRTLFFHRD